MKFSLNTKIIYPDEKKNNYPDRKPVFSYPDRNPGFSYPDEKVSGLIFSR